ncbi:hypothetical protein APR41_17615 [Salegentibacter salinarum]|uniref:Uncharacterized protein n=1 Tax=Salegentibacter salinarum TaxID=447422 RepID=A0A2N0TVP2_9FLAO|nr:hypothetical protein APR41_17615 [Salegentibacter salinarum]
MVVNKQVNLEGTAADGFLIPRAGDFIGSSFEKGVNLKGIYGNSILKSKIGKYSFKGRVN